MRSTLRRSRVSLQGIAFMIVGLGLVIFEMQTEFLLSRLGSSGRIIIFFCGTGFSVWGLKELIAGIYPVFSKTGNSFRLPREGFAYLVIMCVLFIGSLIGRNNLLLMVFASLIGPWVMNGWITFTMLKLLKVSRVLPERIMAGETFTTSLILENQNSWLPAWLMTVHDSITKGDGWISPEVLFVRVPAKSERQGHNQLRLRERGRFQFGPVRITTRFPLGLVERGTRLDVINELLVYPRMGHLTAQWRQLLQNSTELVSDVRTVAGPFNDEMSRIREYRHGDDPRLIHWRTSARVNELMVCDYDESRDRDLLLIIDGWIATETGEVESENFERGLSFATTVCMDHLRNSRESSLVVELATKKPFSWRGDHAESHVENLLDAFAETEAIAQLEVNQILDGVDHGSSSKQRIVIITSRPKAIREAIQHSMDTRFFDAQVYGTSLAELSSVFVEGA